MQGRVSVCCVQQGTKTKTTYVQRHLCGGLPDGGRGQRSDGLPAGDLCAPDFAPQRHEGGEGDLSRRGGSEKNEEKVQSKRDAVSALVFELEDVLDRCGGPSLVSAKHPLRVGREAERVVEGTVGVLEACRLQGVPHRQHPGMHGRGQGGVGGGHGLVVHAQHGESDRFQVLGVPTVPAVDGLDNVGGGVAHRPVLPDGDGLQVLGEAPLNAGKEKERGLGNAERATGCGKT